MTTTISGSTGVGLTGSGNQITFADSTVQNTAATGFGFKNRIINGAMMIDQRNAGASVTVPTSDTYSVDRWLVGATANSKYSAQQNAGSVTPPAGFSNYLGTTSLSAYSVAVGDVFWLQQTIEGLNVADLGWGTANAQTITLSFWVRSSLTGTFGGALRNSASNRSYPFTYTITTANTWEKETITITGDTSGTWLTTNGVGIRVGFGLGAGATYSGTAGAWAGANYVTATGATSVVGTNGATLYITGVQLEVGSTATSFDYRPYGTELALCQRYYQRLGQSVRGYCQGATYGTGASFTLPVVMRATPTWNYLSGPSASANLYSSPYSFQATTSSGGGFFLTSNGAGDTYAFGYVFESSGAEL